MPTDRLLMVPDADTGNIVLKNGRARIYALSLPTHSAFFRTEPERLLSLVTPDEPHHKDRVAFAFRLETEQLLAAWNRTQSSVLARLGDDLQAISGETPP